MWIAFRIRCPSLFRRELFSASFYSWLLRSQFEQFSRINIKGGGKDRHFGIWNPADLGFKFGKRIPAQIPTQKIQFCNKPLLREVFFQSQLPDDRAKDVFLIFQHLTISYCMGIFVPGPAQSRGRIKTAKYDLETFRPKWAAMFLRTSLPANS